MIGVLNVTPDSFSDGGKFFNQQKAYRQAKQMVYAGAKIIDIGGESTRPGSKTVNEKKEWQSGRLPEKRYHTNPGEARTPATRGRLREKRTEAIRLSLGGGELACSGGGGGRRRS